MAGSGILYGVTPEATRGGLGLNGLNNVSGGQGFGVEVMITFVLVFTVLSSVDSDRTDLNGSAPLTIGLSVTVGHLIGVTYLYLYHSLDIEKDIHTNRQRYRAETDIH